MRFRSSFAALCALLFLSALLAVVAEARGAVPSARLLPNGQAVAPPSAPPTRLDRIGTGSDPRVRLAGSGPSGGRTQGGRMAAPFDRPRTTPREVCPGPPDVRARVRIYANREHVFAIIAGLRWDTSYTTDGDRTGPGWSEETRPRGGFRPRHPLGLLAAIPLA